MGVGEGGNWCWLVMVRGRECRGGRGEVVMLVEGGFCFIICGVSVGVWRNWVSFLIDVEVWCG